MKLLDIMQRLAMTTTFGVPKVLANNIIAICGGKRTGKDTLASYIVSKYKYKQIAFADPLKEAVSALFDFSPLQTGNDNVKDDIDTRWGITPRKALQFFGTEVLQYKIQELLPEVERKFLAYSLVNRIQKNEGKYVVSDMRFVHEYEEIAKMGAFIIRIDRPNITTNDYPDEPIHPSEVEYRQIPFHLHISNDGNINDLIQKFEESVVNCYDS